MIITYNMQSFVLENTKVASKEENINHKIKSILQDIQQTPYTTKLNSMQDRSIIYLT